MLTEFKCHPPSYSEREKTVEYFKNRPDVPVQVQNNSDAKLSKEGPSIESEQEKRSDKSDIGKGVK
jgi:hypothetical protein